MEKIPDYLLLEKLGKDEIDRIIMEWFEQPIIENTPIERMAGSILLQALNNPIDVAFFSRERLLGIFLKLTGHGSDMYFIASPNPDQVKIPQLPQQVAGDGVLLYNLARSERRNNG